MRILRQPIKYRHQNIEILCIIATRNHDVDVTHKFLKIKKEIIRKLELKNNQDNKLKMQRYSSRFEDSLT